MGAPCNTREDYMFSFKKSFAAFVGLSLLIVALASLLPLVGRGQGSDNNPLTRDPRRLFYLTQTTHNGSEALTACDAGYHMASLGEIFDTSNLKYDTARGVTTDDSGSGPPANQVGWIRTGSFSDVSSRPGFANCNVWTSHSESDYGTFVLLSSNWDSSDLTRVSPWEPQILACDFTIYVWCLQD